MLFDVKGLRPELCAFLILFKQQEESQQDKPRILKPWDRNTSGKICRAEESQVCKAKGSQVCGEFAFLRFIIGWSYNLTQALV